MEGETDQKYLKKEQNQPNMKLEKESSIEISKTPFEKAKNGKYFYNLISYKNLFVESLNKSNPLNYLSENCFRVVFRSPVLDEKFFLIAKSHNKTDLFSFFYQIKYL